MSGSSKYELSFVVALCEGADLDYSCNLLAIAPSDIVAFAASPKSVRHINDRDVCSVGYENETYV